MFFQSNWQSWQLIILPLSPNKCPHWKLFFFQVVLNKLYGSFLILISISVAMNTYNVPHWLGLQSWNLDPCKFCILQFDQRNWCQKNEFPMWTLISERREYRTSKPITVVKRAYIEACKHSRACKRWFSQWIPGFIQHLFKLTYTTGTDHTKKKQAYDLHIWSHKHFHKFSRYKCQNITTKRVHKTWQLMCIIISFLDNTNLVWSKF